MCLHTLQVGDRNACVVRAAASAADRKAQAAGRSVDVWADLLATADLSALERAEALKRQRKAERVADRWRLEAARLFDSVPAHDHATASEGQQAIAWWVANWHLVESDNTDEAAFNAAAYCANLSKRILGYEPLELWEARAIMFGDGITEQTRRHFSGDIYEVLA